MTDIVERCDHDLAERETACADGMCPLCLAAELAEWKERWAAERRDHETTIRHFDDLMNEEV